MPPLTHRSGPLLVGAIAGFALCYGQVLASVVSAWSTNALYSFGFAVPIISGYMIWAKVPSLKTLRLAPDYVFGTLTLIAGLSLLILGHLAASESLEQVSLPVTLCGAVVLGGGRRAFALTWFPIAYLLLGIPVWEPFVHFLVEPSQRFSGGIAAWLLAAIGIPAAHDGILVLLPKLTLEVLPQCSGVNQLISVVAMTLPAAHLWLRTPWARAALFTVGIAAAYLSNGLRIALVGFLGYMGWGSGNHDGLHLAEGLAVALVGYLMVFACLSLLSKAEPVASRSAPRREHGGFALGAPAPTRQITAFDTVVVAILIVAGAFRALFYPADIRLAADFRAFPNAIDEWALDTSDGAKPAFQLADADEELVRVYRDSHGQTVTLYIGYQRAQAEGKELTDIGRGRQLFAAPVTVALDSRPIELNLVVHPQADRQAGTLFWYDLNGRIVTSRYRVKGYVLLDTLTRRRSNGAVVMVDWKGRAGADFDASRDRAVGFVRALIPILPRYLPS